MNAWSYLPNAAHIDSIIESVKSHPEVWDAILDETRYAARYAARIAAWEAAYDAARIAAWDAALALVAYDAAAKYLNMSSDKLQVWAILSEDPAAVLLLPAVTAYEKINELETV